MQLQSTHVDDMVGTTIGGNSPTGGNTGVGTLKSHSAYGPNAPQTLSDPSWGYGKTSVVVTVEPTNVKKADDEEEEKK